VKELPKVKGKKQDSEEESVEESVEYSEEEEESPKVGKVQKLKKQEEQVSELSMSNASDNFIVRNASFASKKGPIEKNESSMSKMKGDKQAMFNKSKINGSTMRLDFDDREDQQDYRI